MKCRVCNRFVVQDNSRGRLREVCKNPECQRKNAAILNRKSYRIKKGKRSCPIDPETGKFQSSVAEAAFEEAMRLGVIIDRPTMQKILQAHNAAEDLSNYQYEAFKAKRAANAHT